MKYIIDYENGSGSGCDKVFTSVEDAQWHINTFYTEQEKDGLIVVPIEDEKTC